MKNGTELGRDAYDVAIVGGGPPGASPLYALSPYTECSAIVMLLEKYNKLRRQTHATIVTIRRCILVISKELLVGYNTIAGYQFLQIAV
ncbi:MAG: hypothetical protein WEC84_04120 [Candidatus Andersenbacteria bacterium]